MQLFELTITKQGGPILWLSRHSYWSSIKRAQARALALGLDESEYTISPYEWIRAA